MPTFKNQPYDYGITLIESELEVRSELLDQRQAFIDALKEVISKQKHLPHRDLLSQGHRKRIKQLQNLISFVDCFSEHDSLEKLEKDNAQLERLNLVLSGWVYFTLEEIELDLIEQGQYLEKDSFYSLLSGDLIRPFLHQNRIQSIEAFIGQMDVPKPKLLRQKGEELPVASLTNNSFFHETDFIQKKRELPMSNVREYYLNEQTEVIDGLNALDANYQYFVDHIFENSSSRSGRTRTPAHRHLEAIDALKAHLDFLDEFNENDSIDKQLSDIDKIITLNDVVKGHALVMAEKLEQTAQKTGSSVVNNAWYQALLHTFDLAYMPLDEQEYAKEQYYQSVSKEKTFDEFMQTSRDFHLKSVDINAQMAAKVKYDAAAHNQARQHTHRAETSVLREERKNLKHDPKIRSLVSAAKSVRDVYHAEYLANQKASESKQGLLDQIQSYALPKSEGFSLSRRHLEALDELESMFNFMEKGKFSSQDPSMKVQQDIHDLNSLQTRLFGCVLSIASRFPNSPLDKALNRRFGIQEMAPSQKEECIRAYENYRQQRAETSPNSDRQLEAVAHTAHRRRFLNTAEIHELNKKASTRRDDELIDRGSRMIDERQSALDEIRPVMHQIYQLEARYNELKPEKAKARWFGEMRDTMFGSDGKKPAEGRTEVIKQLKEMILFAKHFDNTDENIKIGTDTQRLSLIANAIVGAAVTEYDNIRASYTVQKATNSALYCALNDVFKISAMSDEKRAELKEAYQQYQSTYHPQQEEVVNARGGMSWNISMA